MSAAFSISLAAMQGPAGAAGSRVHYGDGAPSNGLGADGDTYVDKTGNALYLKVSGVWVFQYAFPSAEPGAFTKLSSGTISANRVVRYVDATHVGYADAATAAHAPQVAGIALTAAGGAEENVSVQRLGEATDSLWTWTPGLPVFLGANGVLTQTHNPAWAFSLVVGVALSTTRMSVDIKQPIFQG